MSRIPSLSLFIILAASTVAAVELGDKSAGHAYAQKVCAQCHAVEKDTNYLFAQVPSFQEIADTEGMTPRALLVWLQTPHPNMPDFIIPPPDMDNLIAYVELVDDEAYEVVWVVSGAGVESFTRLEDILRAAFERLSRADENDDARPARLTLVPDSVADMPAESAR